MWTPIHNLRCIALHQREINEIRWKDGGVIQMVTRFYSSIIPPQSERRGILCLENSATTSTLL